MAWEYALIIGIIVGIILGVIIIRLNGSGAQQKALQEELDKTKEELEQYRSNISEHFKRSSVLLNNMVNEYSQLYNHISKASHEFSTDHESLPNPFDFRVVDATSTTVEQESNEEVNALVDLADDKPIQAEETPVTEETETEVKKEEPPRDYSEGASGLLRTERKE